MGNSFTSAKCTWQCDLTSIINRRVDLQKGWLQPPLHDVCALLSSVTLYGVFTNHSCMGVATRCLLLELLDVSVSELLVRGTSGGQSGR